MEQARGSGATDGTMRVDVGYVPDVVQRYRTGYISPHRIGREGVAVRQMPFVVPLRPQAQYQRSQLTVARPPYLVEEECGEECGEDRPAPPRPPLPGTARPLAGALRCCCAPRWPPPPRRSLRWSLRWPPLASDLAAQELKILLQVFQKSLAYVPGRG
jgi:hypothetical protein